MTNRERVEAYIGFKPANGNAIEAALIDQDLSGTGTYDISGSLSVKKAAVEVMKILLSTADTVNESGYAIKFDRPSLLKRIADLEEEISPTSRDKIRSKRPW